MQFILVVAMCARLNGTDLDRCVGHIHQEWYKSEADCDKRRWPAFVGAKAEWEQRNFSMFFFEATCRGVGARL